MKERLYYFYWDVIRELIHFAHKKGWIIAEEGNGSHGNPFIVGGKTLGNKPCTYRRVL